jgi:hypothetical protein
MWDLWPGIGTIGPFEATVPRYEAYPDYLCAYYTSVMVNTFVLDRRVVTL